jgi:hypothetical protein
MSKYGDCPACNFPLSNYYACSVCSWVTPNEVLMHEMVREYLELRQLKEYLVKNLHWEEDDIIIRELCNKLGVK